MKKLLLIGLLALGYSRASAQTLSLSQLIAIRDLTDLPTINDYLTAKGWEFDQSEPGDSIDQIVWLHKTAAGRGDASLNILMCNTCGNAFCDKCYIHQAGNGGQHAYTLFYQPNKTAFMLIKQQAAAAKMEVKTMLYPKAINTVYTGANYQLQMNVSAPSGNAPTRYFITLARKPASEN